MTTTDVLGHIIANGKPHFLFGNGITDGTETEVKIRDISGAFISVGTHLKGQTITEIGIQCSDGSICTTCIYYGPDGGVKASWRGNERTTWARLNLEAKQLNIRVQDGDVLKVNAGD